MRVLGHVGSLILNVQKDNAAVKREALAVGIREERNPPMTQATQASKHSPSRSTGQLWLRGVVGPLIMFGLLFLSAGRLDYWQGWLYVGINIGSAAYGDLAIAASRIDRGTAAPRRGG